MRRAATAAAAAVVLLGGCASTGPDASTAPGSASKNPSSSAALQEETQGALLAEHGLDGLEPVQIVDTLDRLPLDERPADLIASVRPDQLVLSGAAGGGETSLPLPEERFYVSVAPYVTSTHECFHHSLTTCKGELGGQDVRVTVTDDAGEVVLDEEMTTFDNGFVGMWLPRGVEGTIAVAYDGKQGEVRFGTGDEDPTCLTTLQLA